MRSEAEVEQALRNYGDMIRRICFVHLQKEADTEDVFQNVFFKYAVKTAPFTSDQHEKAWLIRIAINECNSLKRRFFQRKVELSDDLSTYGEIQSPKHPEVIYALLRLPTHYRNVIYLIYYEGYQQKEIAAILQKKEATIATWHRRAKQALKEDLGGDEFEEPTR
ncbi:MAG: sigma-70 family RNA polymerase sigma factor [Erysipelotrichaceae bacterium]|nr:sigma-70 family RNA polymerase sigma factor [Erysipelotrichaceae bacterium]MCI9312858.1 sigma-70 family RNA polymerase sigma factor [Erysipelotrichaceae bacterium]